MAELRNEKRMDKAQPLASHQETRPRVTEAIMPRRQPGGLGLRSRDPFSMMNDLFENFGFGGSLLPLLSRGMERSGLWSPQIELWEQDGKLHVRADLPGMSKDDVHCEVKDDVLIIEGERKQEQHDERGWSERSYGNFYRAISLPEGVKSDNAQASFKNGVLEITLDVQKKETQGKKIQIL